MIGYRGKRLLDLSLTTPGLISLFPVLIVVTDFAAENGIVQK